MGEHLIDGQFQSDKYPWCKPNFVPLKVTVNDPNALKVLKEYAELRRPIDSEFADDLLEAIRIEEARMTGDLDALDVFDHKTCAG